MPRSPQTLAVAAKTGVIAISVPSECHGIRLAMYRILAEEKNNPLL